MSFTLKNWTYISAASDTCSRAVSGTPVLAGDLIVAWCSWGFDGLTRTFGDDVTTSYAGATANTGGLWSQANGQFFYKEASVATGFPTYTFTATGSFVPGFIVYVFTPSGTATYDNSISSASLGGAGSTIPDSGSLITSGTDTLAFGAMMCENNAMLVTGNTIGGVSATSDAVAFADSTFTRAMWYLATSGTVNAVAQLASSQKWLANAISFINTPLSSGGGSSSSWSNNSQVRKARTSGMVTY